MSDYANLFPDNQNANGVSAFREFLQKEYDNIAQAHFKTTEMVSEYLRYYITVVTIPFTVLIILLNPQLLKDVLHLSETNATQLFGVVFFLVISVVGLMFFWYIMNLRLDALLYARAVNGIRKYFYDQNSGMDLPSKYRIRVLPQSPYLPIYREISFFGPIVIFFTLINSVYFYIALILGQFLSAGQNPSMSWITWIGTILYAYLHVFLYLYLAQRRELSYLQSNIIGVDIDGVLNKQADQFCKFLEKNTRKSVSTNDITRIPVHECEGLNVDRVDEKSVFNDHEYWTSIEAQRDAAEVLSRLRKSLKLRVHIFTSRPWPMNDDGPGLRKLIGEWKIASGEFKMNYYRKLKLSRVDIVLDRAKEKLGEIPGLFPYKILRFASIFGRTSPMESITRTWLRNNGFEYDKLMVEGGSEEVADPSAHIHNRFYASRIMSIKYFVEDDLIKAEKLAYICEIVFLFDQPYNQKENLPANVVRVKDWNEILRVMRTLS